jgi:curved DNA-binding protein CbpA
MEVTRAYATLGVSTDASWREIRRAYRAQLRQHHPDTGAANPRALDSARSAYRQLRTQRPQPAPAAVWPPQAPPVGRLVDVYA